MIFFGLLDALPANSMMVIADDNRHIDVPVVGMQTDITFAYTFLESLGEVVLVKLLRWLLVHQDK